MADNLDLLRELARRYYNIHYDQVTKEQRTLAKRALYVYLYNGKQYHIEELMALGLPMMAALEQTDKEEQENGR